MAHPKFQELLNKESKISVIRLGYVGLPIALELARHFQVVGFDIKEERVAQMQRQEDPSKELEAADFADCDIQFTSKPDDLRAATFHVVAVPTPINRHNLPDLHPLLSASKTVGEILKKGDCVVFESTVRSEERRVGKECRSRRA